MSVYKAIDIAQYIINYAYTHGEPISNLQLQKILYFIWIDFYNQTKQYLFDDRIEAWQYGPVVPSVYNEYSSFSSLELLFKYDIPLNRKDYNSIDFFIDSYYKKSASYLVDKSHKKGSSWDLVYQEGCKNTIPFQTIIELDCKGA